jgi:transposase-like protein
MAGKRTRYSADFKAKVVLEALRGELREWLAPGRAVPNAMRR